MKYTVCFEFYGRKMRTVVDATSEEQARRIVTNRLIFLKVEKKEDDLEFLKGVFNFK